MDNTTERTNAFLVSTSHGPVMVTVPSSMLSSDWNTTRQDKVVTSWLLDGELTFPREAMQSHGLTHAMLNPPPALTSRLHALKMRSEPTEIGERLRVVSCSGSSVHCNPFVTAVRVRTGGTAAGVTAESGAPNWAELAGAPAFDQDGAVAGIVIPTSPNSDPWVVPVPAIMNHLAPKKN